MRSVGTLLKIRNRSYRPIRCDRHAWNDPVIVSGVFDRGNQAEIDLIRVEQLRALCGNVEPQIESIRFAFQPMNQRPRVEVTDCSEPNGHAIPAGRKRPSRSTGSKPAA
jgi:hypothetical protein